MDSMILFLAVCCLCTSAYGSSFSDFQAALNNAAQDLSKIDKASADKFKYSVGLPQEPPSILPPISSTTVAPKNCGWFSKCEESTTTTTTTTTTTPAPPTTTAEPCGGWFQKACPKVLDSAITTTTTTTTTTTEAPTTPKACGGWFQPACEEAQPKALEATQPPSTVATPTPTDCGGWFQPACANPLTLTATLPVAEPTTPKPCGGWFQSACDTPIASTPAPSGKSCGWFGCSEETTTPEPSKKASGLFGTYSEATTPSPSQAGWFSGIITGLTSTAGKAVGTALDVTSKIATTTMNGGVDFFLTEIKIIVKSTNMDVVPLPDIDIPLYPGASLKASGGYFKSVLSLSRGGDITISRDGLAFIIDFPVVLRDMEIGFKNYSIAVLMGMGTSGDIKVGVKENKINIRIRLTMSTSCAINLEKVDFAVLDGLDIQMSYGCSMCGFITDKASTYLANFLKNTIRLQIQGQIDSILKQTLSESSLICSKFMGV